MLSRLLDHAGGSAIFHEPDFNDDVSAMQPAISTPGAAREYIGRFRRYRIARRIRETGPGLYGEVTSTLGYHGQALAEFVPNARIQILARDGRDVVRSLMAMPFYGPSAKGPNNLRPGTGDVYPAPDDPFADQWSHMSRFAKMCWRWLSVYEHLLAFDPPAPVVRMEQILADYDYFEKMILTPTQLSIPEATWAEFAQKPMNATPRHAFPRWQDWSADDQRTFNRICGPIMERLGYAH